MPAVPAMYDQLLRHLDQNGAPLDAPALRLIGTGGAPLDPGWKARIEARFGVEKEVVAAIWGMESNYGRFRGSTPIIPALATLAAASLAAFASERLLALVSRFRDPPPADTGS